MQTHECEQEELGRAFMEAPTNMHGSLMVDELCALWRSRECRVPIIQMLRFLHQLRERELDIWGGDSSLGLMLSRCPELVPESAAVSRGESLDEAILEPYRHYIVELIRYLQYANMSDVAFTRLTVDAREDPNGRPCPLTALRLEACVLALTTSGRARLLGELAEAARTRDVGAMIAALRRRLYDVTLVLRQADFDPDLHWQAAYERLVFHAAEHPVSLFRHFGFTFDYRTDGVEADCACAGAGFKVCWVRGCEERGRVVARSMPLERAALIEVRGDAGASFAVAQPTGETVHVAEMFISQHTNNFKSALDFTRTDEGIVVSCRDAADASRVSLSLTVRVGGADASAACIIL